ncbi:hypothetical protein, partial [Williamsia soli]|uniref:hypothetical protein n=1 Tax=Williamsia soli TaxID=364929 RepID=UPI001A9F42A0
MGARFSGADRAFATADRALPPVLGSRERRNTLRKEGDSMGTPPVPVMKVRMFWQLKAGGVSTK